MATVATRFCSETRTAACFAWTPAIRNDGLNSGFIKSAKPAARRSVLNQSSPRLATIRKRALGGTNKIPLPLPPPGLELLSIKTVLPDRSVRLDLVRWEPDTELL